MKLVENPYVSEFTRKTLEQFGWKDNDPIPEDLGQLLLKFKESVPASKRTDVLVDAELLSAEHIAEVKDMLAEAKVVAKRQAKEAEFEERVATMPPGAAELYQQLEAAEEAGPAVSVVDDREPAAATSPAQEKISAVTEPASVEPAAAELATETPPMIILPFCPRCGWDMRQKFETPVTDKDKEDFVAALLGGTRFQRKFEILGGKMVLVFRSLLAEENRLIFRQLTLDQQETAFATADEWFLRLMEYRLACSLDRITDKIGKPMHTVPTLGEYPHTPPADKPLQTALVPLLDYVNNKVLPQEVMRRLAGQHLKQFQRVVEALEAMALEPSFWNGIE